jgi:hypothetical protein
MPLKLNGYEVPWTGLSLVVGGIFWLAGLSFTVAANSDELAKLSTHEVDDTERLIRIEEREAAVEEDVKEVKQEVAAIRQAQTDAQKTLALILAEVKKDE